MRLKYYRLPGKHELDSHSSFTRFTPQKRIPALITPIKAPPAMNPEARRVPFSLRSEFIASSLERVVTYQLIAPPTKSGIFNSNGINIPNANASAGIPQSVSTMARTAPIP